MEKSKTNSIINLEYLKTAKENLYFDRKRAKIALQDLANVIASFANANGGVVAIGITDTGEIEGFNSCGIKKLNECQKVITTYLKPTPIYKMEVLKVINSKNEEDNILLFHIEPTIDDIIKNNKDEVYYRQGDASIKLTIDQIRSLEYDKRERDFETEIILNSSIDDLDLEVMEIYKERINASNISNEQILKARVFLQEVNGILRFTKAGMLLFGKNPSLYLPSARVRVVKFEGTQMQVGRDLNVVKDRSFDKCLYKSIIEAKDFINSQLREFTHLNTFGIFETIPEYPEFAWFEGMVNAVIHRDYSNCGEHIIIKLYDDRLEILSPGRLGGFITVDTMKTKRYSRNPKIARVLNEFGIARELNEGVKRIYSEMQSFFLNDPKYIEPDKYSLLLVLENNVVVRGRRKQESMIRVDNIKEKWNDLNYKEQQVLLAIYDKGEITTLEAASIINRGKTTTIKLLNKLIDLKLIVWTGTSKNDCYGTYIIK